MRIQTIIGIEKDKIHVLATPEMGLVEQEKFIKALKVGYGRTKVGKKDVQLDCIHVFDSPKTIRFKGYPALAAAAASTSEE